VTKIVTVGWSDVKANVMLISNCCVNCIEPMQKNSRDS
jgi:hypothetical protein